MKNNIGNVVDKVMKDTGVVVSEKPAVDNNIGATIEATLDGVDVTSNIFVDLYCTYIC